jgi:uncharacterized coiled-coil DUF342 family protein
VVQSESEGAQESNNQAPESAILDMAVEFGSLRSQYGQTASELSELRNQQQQTAAMLQEALSELRALRSSQERVETELEQTEMEELVEEEQTGTLEITPPMETSIQIEQKPVMERSLIQRLMYGGR